jgi:RNA polymerase sigma factor (sigma-70 family)
MARSSEERELDRLVSEHLPTALRFATRLTGDVDQAEDVVQEALVRAARSWKTFRGEAQFRTWLFRIVINVFRSHSAAVAHRPTTLPETLADRRVADPARGAQDRELAELIAERVSALPERQREVMVLTSFEGFSVQEAAKLLEITEANVYSTLAVARARLSKELAPYFVRR